jgi:TPR repeat protein
MVLMTVKWNTPSSGYFINLRGKVKNDKKAVENWSIGAEKGQLQCMKNLAWAYANGIGVEVDMMMSQYWNDQADCSR